MANILLTWEMGGGAGHCTKLVPIARLLLSAGHSVSIATRNVDTANRFFNSLPVRIYQAPRPHGQAKDRINWPRTLPEILYNTRFGDSEQLERLVAEWHEIFHLTRPAVVVCDYSPTVMLASRGYDHSRVVLGTGFEIPPIETPLPSLEYWHTNQDIGNLVTTEHRVLERINSLLERYRLRQLTQFSDLFSDADLTFLLTFAELDHYPSRSEPNYFGVLNTPSGCVLRWPEADGPRVFCYLKPPRRNWELGKLLSLLSDQQIATIAYVPGADSGWLAAFESKTLHITYEPVDIRQIAVDCDAAILNANAGTVAEFLLSGLPILNIPLQLEQLVTAHRVADLGAGMIARAPDAANIMRNLTEVLDSADYTDSACRFSQKYATFEPNKNAELIANCIDKLL